MIRESNLEPIDYCRKWADIPEGERGFRKASVIALMKATSLKESTISNWGEDFRRRPDSVLRTLELADKLKQIHQAIVSLDL